MNSRMDPAIAQERCYILKKSMSRCREDIDMSKRTLRRGEAGGCMQDQGCPKTSPRKLNYLAILKSSRLVKNYGKCGFILLEGTRSEVSRGKSGLTQVSARTALERCASEVDAAHDDR